MFPAGTITYERRPARAAYAAADAEWTLRLYVAQQEDVLRQGLYAHLQTIEFPFAIANVKLAGAALVPFGKSVMSAEAAEAQRYRVVLAVAPLDER